MIKNRVNELKLIFSLEQTIHFFISVHWVDFGSKIVTTVSDNHSFDEAFLLCETFARSSPCFRPYACSSHRSDLRTFSKTG